jgi:hypothetical protein
LFVREHLEWPSMGFAMPVSLQSSSPVVLLLRNIVTSQNSCSSSVACGLVSIAFAREWQSLSRAKSFCRMRRRNSRPRLAAASCRPLALR